MTSTNNQDHEDGDTLLQLQTLNVSNSRKKGFRSDSIAMWDPGSTLAFITFGLADRLKLEGIPIELEICTVGGVMTKIDSKKYSISVFNRNGQDVKIEVLGIEKISTEVEAIDLADMKKLFRNEETKHVERPTSGSVDLLIGFSYAAYHPVKVEEVGHLLFMRNRFGGVIAGSHTSIQETTKKLVKHAIVLHSVANIEEFHSIESLGVTCYPKCGGCRCGKQEGKI